MRSFYYAIEEDPADQTYRERTVQSITAAAEAPGISCHVEVREYGGLTAVYITIEDEQDALIFKVAAPPALVCSWSPACAPQPSNGAP